MDRTMNGWLRLGLSLSLLGSGACASAREPARVTDDLACAPGELRSAWWSDTPLQTNRHGSHLLVVGGEGERAAVYDLFRHGALRLADGRVSDLETPDATALGLRFTRDATTLDAMGRSDLAGATEVLEVGRDAPLRVIPWAVPRDAEHWSGVTSVVSADRARVFLLEHASTLGATDARFFVRRAGIGDGAADRTIDLGTSEPDPFGAAALWVDDARDVAYVTLEGAPDDELISLVRVSLEDGALVRTSLAIPETDRLLGRPAVGAPPARVLDVAPTHDGAHVLVTGRDGLLRVLDAQTLEPAADASPVGVAVANEDTYLPSLRSPIALSAGDHWLASLDLEGHVVLVDRRDGHVAARLGSAAPALPPSDWSRTEHTPIAIRFLPDGLLVASDGGVERFRCAGI